MSEKTEKQLLFIEEEGDLELILEYYRKNSLTAQSSVIVAGNANIMHDINKKGFNSYGLDKYIDLEKRLQVQETAMQWSNSWFRDSSGKDLSERFGLSFGELGNIVKFYFFNYLLKSVVQVKCILETERPDIVVLTDKSRKKVQKDGIIATHNELFHMLREETGYKIHCLKGDSVSDQGKRPLNSTSFINGSVSKNLMDAGKKSLIFFADKIKNTIWPCSGNLFLTFSASDISYFGEEFLDELLKGNKSCLLYLYDEKNCFFRRNLQKAELKGDLETKRKRQQENMLSDIGECWDVIIENIKSSPRYRFCGISLNEVVGDFIKKYFENEIPDLLELDLRLRGLFSKYTINVVLVSAIWSSKIMLLMARAKENGLPVVHIPHGIVQGYFKDGNFIQHPAYDTKYFPFYPSYEVSGLKHNLDLQVKRGISPEKLLFAGLPRYSSKKCPTRGEVRTKAREKLGLNNRREVVLFGACGVNLFNDRFGLPLHLTSFESLKMYENLILKFKDSEYFKLVFKFKKSDILTFPVREMVSNLKADNVYVFTDHLESLFLASDYVITVYSNIGMEALFYEIPVIIFNLPDRYPSHLPIAGAGILPEVESVEELERTLDEIRKSPGLREKAVLKQNNYLKENLPEDKISSSQKVVELINGLGKVRETAIPNHANS